MSKKPRVNFKLKRIAADDWQVECTCEGTETRYVKGFKTKMEVDEWLSGSRKIDWLREHGYAK